jgi:hypothetical protein
LSGTITRARKLAAGVEWVFGRRMARVLAVVAFFVVAAAVLWVFLNWYIAPTKPTERKDLVLALAQILAGAALLSGLYFTWRTLQVNREGQITERFTRAIEHLGSTDDNGTKLTEIRLGGIYALERIARDSERDHWPIMEVLTAYVRQNALQRLADDHGRKGAEEGKAGEVYVAAPDVDIQAIMLVIRRRARHFGHGETEFIDLHRADLRGANLYKANLYGAYFHGAHLSGANLSATDLSGTDLSGARLEGANLSEAILWGAILAGAHLEGANLSEAKGLISEQLQEAMTDDGTKLPAYADIRTSESAYKVKEGDTLWQIAQEVYGDGNRWRQIRDANLWILDPDRIQAGW